MVTLSWPREIGMIASFERGALLCAHCVFVINLACFIYPCLYFFSVNISSLSCLSHPQRTNVKTGYIFHSVCSVCLNRPFFQLGVFTARAGPASCQPASTASSTASSGDGSNSRTTTAATSATTPPRDHAVPVQKRLHDLDLRGRPRFPVGRDALQSAAWPHSHAEHAQPWPPFGEKIRFSLFLVFN